MPKQRTWTAAQLRRAVEGGGGWPPASSMIEITRRLGIRQGGSNNAVIRDYAEGMGLELPDYFGERGRARLAELEAEVSKRRAKLGLSD